MRFVDDTNPFSTPDISQEEAAVIRASRPDYAMADNPSEDEDCDFVAVKKITFDQVVAAAVSGKEVKVFTGSWHVGLAAVAAKLRSAGNFVYIDGEDYFVIAA